MRWLVLSLLSGCALTDDITSCRVECEDCRKVVIECEEKRAKAEPIR